MVAKLIGNDRYLLNDISEAQKTQRAFNSVFASDSMRPRCHVLDEDPDESHPKEDPQRSARTSLVVAGRVVSDTCPSVICSALANRELRS